MQFDHVDIHCIIYIGKIMSLLMRFDRINMKNMRKSLCCAICSALGAANFCLLLYDTCDNQITPRGVTSFIRASSQFNRTRQDYIMLVLHYACSVCTQKNVCIFCYFRVHELGQSEQSRTCVILDKRGNPLL